MGLWWLGKVGRGHGRRRAGEFRPGPARRQFPSLSCSRPRPPPPQAPPVPRVTLEVHRRGRLEWDFRETLLWSHPWERLQQVEYRLLTALQDQLEL